jgi:RNA polymerase sigma-70 factor (ECF subfamily)
VNKQIGVDEFLELVEKHKDEFYRFVLRTVWDKHTAEDVFAAGVLAAYENRAKFTPGTNFRAWVFRILMNKCFVANRETARTPQPLDKVEEPSLTSIQQEPGYSEILEEPMKVLDECGDEVYRAFGCLNTAERSCILLRGVERFSYKEIAEILEIPVGTVMTHLARGRAKLRKELLEYAQEQGIVRRFPRLLQKDDESGAEKRGRRESK